MNNSINNTENIHSTNSNIENSNVSKKNDDFQRKFVLTKCNNSCIKYYKNGIDQGKAFSDIYGGMVI